MMLARLRDWTKRFICYRLLRKNPEIYREADGIIFRYFSRSDSLEELTILINRAYATHKEKGLNYLAATQDSGITKKRIRKSYCIIAIHDGKIVGTLTIKPPWRTKGSPWYNRRKVCKFNQFAVDPDLQSKGIGEHFNQIGEHLAVVLGAKELACDTSEHADKLIDYYLKRGYRIIEYAQWKSTNYRSVIMSKRVAD